MSYSRQDEAIDDCFEINHRIVARQKAAIELLEAILADQSDREEHDNVNDTKEVIKILKGET